MKIGSIAIVQSNISSSNVRSISMEKNVNIVAAKILRSNKTGLFQAMIAAPIHAAARFVAILAATFLNARENIHDGNLPIRE